MLLPWGRLPIPAPIAGDDLERLLAVALDAGNDEPMRVSAVISLRGSVDDVARRLVPILNEPLPWLGIETIDAIRSLDPEMAIGVVSARVVASPTTTRDLFFDEQRGGLYCAELGADVFALGEVDELVDLVPEPLLWMQPPGNAWHQDDDDDDESIRSPRGRRLVVRESTIHWGQEVSVVRTAVPIGGALLLRVGDGVVGRLVALPDGAGIVGAGDPRRPGTWPAVWVGLDATEPQQVGVLEVFARPDRGEIEVSFVT
ncbi:MAG: hypothetical protein Q8O67_09165 [Deltaproteobacteria bacterium]|nr:hypothetical protein [Deltaproteobacteria bacterium]